VRPTVSAARRRGGQVGGWVATNEPAGFTTVYDNPMTSVPPLGSNDAFNFQRFETEGNTLSVVDGALRCTYLSTMTAGQYSTPFRAGFEFSGASLDAPKTELYVRVRFRISAAWSDNGNSGTKFFFFSQLTEGGHQNNHYVNLTTLGALSPEIRIQRSGWTFGGSGSVNYPASPFTGLTAGDWHTLEFYAKANTVVAGVSEAGDGIGKIWMDGTLLLNQTNIAYFSRNQLPCWRGLYCNPTYGGGTIKPPTDLALDIDNWYTSTKA